MWLSNGFIREHSMSTPDRRNMLKDRAAYQHDRWSTRWSSNSPTFLAYLLPFPLYSVYKKNAQHMSIETCHALRSSIPSPSFQRSHNKCHYRTPRRCFISREVVFFPRILSFGWCCEIRDSLSGRVRPKVYDSVPFCSIVLWVFICLSTGWFEGPEIFLQNMSQFLTLAQYQKLFRNRRRIKCQAQFYHHRHHSGD